MRALVVEDDPGIASGLSLSLRQAGYAVDVCGTLESAWTALCVEPFDAVLLDLGLPDGSGIDVISHCLRVQPACEVMVITMFGDETNMMKAFSAGAKGYLLKDGTEDDLAGHITQLRNGGSPMSPIIARQLLGRLGPPAVAAPAAAGGAVQLSPKEAEVLSLVSRGFSYSEVAQLLHISVHTVHTHARNIYGKLSVKSKTEAVYEARQLGILKN